MTSKQKSDRNHIKNLTETERKYWDKIDHILENLFDDLKSQSLIRTTFRRDEVENLLKIIELSNKFFENYNTFTKLIESQEKTDKFMEMNNEFGFNGNNLPYVYLSEIVSNFTRNTELFKTMFLFILKKGTGFKDKMTLYPFLDKLSKTSKKYGEDMKNEVDVKLRNSFSHGLFWQDRTTIYYSEDISLKTIKKIQLGKLMLKTKNHNIIAQCLINKVAEKVRGGFFIKNKY